MGQVRAAAAAPELPPPTPLGYLGPSRRGGCRGLTASDTCFTGTPPSPALPGLQLQPPPAPGLGRDPSSRSSSWLLATASSSCPGSLGRAPPNPHGPTAAAAAWAVTVLGSLGPAGSAPPHSAAPPHPWPRPLAQAPPPPGRQSFFAAGSAPFPPLPHSAGRHHPCLGVCACLGPAAVSAGRPFYGRL